MAEKTFFSKLVTKDLTAIDSNRRLFEGVLTVEMKDKQGEITVRDELLKVLPIWIARGGPITDTHSNRVVGQGINFQATTVTDSEGQNYPAITIQGEIFKDYELDDEIWKSIRDGTYKGLSFGGATKSNRTPIMQKDGSVAYSLKDLEQYEVAVCEEPAVPLALITQHNAIAKAMAGKTVDRGDGRMCIRCDKFKCYVEKDSLVKIEDDEDDNTQVTVLDEWKNETHPDKNGKTEGIRTTKGDDTYSDTRGPNTPNKDEDAEALENNRGEPQENGATYHGTSKGRTHTCDADVREVNNVEVGDKPAGQNLVKDDVKAMDEDNPEALEEAGLEEEKKDTTFADAVDDKGSGEIYGDNNPYDDNPGKKTRTGKKIPKVMGKDTRQIETKPTGHGRFNNDSTGMSSTGETGPKSKPMSAGRLAARARRAGFKTASNTLDLLNLLLKVKLDPPGQVKREGELQGVKPSIVGNKKIGRTLESQTPGNVNPKKESMEHGSVGDASTSHYQATHLDPDVAESMKSDYQTDDVVREYDDGKKKLEKTETCTNTYTEPGRGGFAGREPGETCDKNESTSIHNVNQPKHVNEAYNDEDAEALKSERSFTANNAEDGVNGKSRINEDKDAEAFSDKSFAVNNPGMGSGGIRSGASYDNAQQDTGAKDNPRKQTIDEYSGEEDRGVLNPRDTETEEAKTVPKDAISASDNARFNKASLILNKLLFDLKH
jgi:hypothetical protein